MPNSISFFSLYLRNLMSTHTTPHTSIHTTIATAINTMVAISIPFLLLTLLSLPLAIVLKLRFSRRRSLRLPPGNLGLPFVGETLQLISAYKTENPEPFVDERVKQFGPVFKTHVFGERTVFSADPEINRFILQNEGTLFDCSYPGSISNLLGKHSLLLMKGSLHKRMHSLTMSFGNSSIIKDHLLVDIDRLIRLNLDSWPDRVLLMEEAKKITFNLTVKQLMSYDPCDWTEMLRKEYVLVIEGFFSVPISLFSPTYRRAITARTKVAEALRLVVKKRRKEGSEGGGERKKDMLAALLGDGDGFSDEQIVDFMVALLVAGYETTSTIMTLGVKFLTESPLALAQLRAMDSQDEYGSYLGMFNGISCTPQTQQSVPDTQLDRLEEDEPQYSPPIDTQETENPTKPRKQSHFNKDEDEVLISAWLNTTLDAAVGTDQSQDTYWMRVEKLYNETRPPGTPPRPNVQCRWKLIHRITLKFKGYYKQAKDQLGSGYNPSDALANAKQLYFKVEKVSFGLSHCWEELSKHPKWMDLADIQKKGKEKANKKKRASTTDSDVPTMINLDVDSSPSTLDDASRPPGRKAAKVDQKVQKMLASQTEKLNNQLLELQAEKKLAREESRAEKQLESDHRRKAHEEKMQLAYEGLLLEKKKQELEEERMRKQDEDNIMCMDLTSLDEVQKSYIIARRKEILAKQLAKGF